MKPEDAHRSDDEFLTALSQGVDPSDGEDELATLFLELRDDVEAPMPEVVLPEVVLAEATLDADENEDVDPEVGDVDTVVVPVVEDADEDAEPAVDDADTVVAPVVEDADTDAEPVVDADTAAAPVSLDVERKKRRAHRTNPWLAGLVGAAAATVVVAGTGAALYNATPGSPLWGPSQKLFGGNTDYVELASTLDEIDSKAEQGDIEGARNLIEQLRSSLKAERTDRGNRGDSEREPTTTPRAGKETVTVTTERKKEEAERPSSQAPAPDTVTVTVVVTEPAAPGSQPAPGAQPAPSNAATPTPAPAPAPAPSAPAPSGAPSSPATSSDQTN